MEEQLNLFLKSLIPESIDFSVEPSARPDFGHYATNVAMKLASVRGEAPLTIAEQIAKDAREKGMHLLSRVEVARPGFINFWLSDSALEEGMKGVLSAGKKWGRPASRAGSGKPTKNEKKTIVIDYSHPNIAKPMSVAHLRSTIIGAALYNVFAFSGWKTVGDNHLGDWGKQFGVLIAAYKEISNLKNKKSNIKIEDLLVLYVDYTARMKENPELEESARRETKKLQEGDRENTAIWKLFYKISLAEFKKAYSLLGVSFDYYLGESFYKSMLPEIVQEALYRGIAERSEGAVIIPHEGIPSFVIQKSDEAFLYSTTDLAAIKYRREKFKADTVLYVVDNGQSLHFEQLFRSAEKLGFVGSMQLMHVKFGLVLAEDMKKLSTRAGRHVALLEVIHEAVDRAQKIVDEKRADITKRKREKIAKAVGIAALKYNDLSQNRQSDITFRWDAMLSFEGNSAPYLLYSYARIKSILRKAGRFSRGKVVFTNDAERNLAIMVMRFPGVLDKVRETFFPHYLAEYLYELAKTVNSFYENIPVLKAEKEMRRSRISLVASAAETLNTGLTLLGIQTVETM
ncbi:MAG: arginine--tRNA ligase [Patescibacteria group bacterium]